MNRYVEAVWAHLRAVTGWLSVEENRGDLYRLLVLLSPIAVATGYVTDVQAAQALGYAGALLGVSLAAGNTRSKRVGPGPRKRNR